MERGQVEVSLLVITLTKSTFRKSFSKMHTQTLSIVISIRTRVSLEVNFVKVLNFNKVKFCIPREGLHHCLSSFCGMAFKLGQKSEW
jgi:hypothetical protein